MSSPKLSLEAVSDTGLWDALVRRSPQGTLFSESFYLDAVGCQRHLWWVKQGQEIKAGVCLVVSEDERHCRLDDLVIYGGILFDLDPNRQMVKRRHDQFQIAEFVAERLAEHYDSIEMALSPQFEDMRPFLWYRYHDEAIHKYALDLRYTSCLDIRVLKDCAGDGEESDFFANMETVRRYSVREARKKQGRAVEAEDGRILLDYYGSLMAKQGDPQSQDKLAAMGRVMQALIAAGRGKVFHVLDAAGNILYAVMYGWDAKRAYYLFGAGHPELSAPWQGTLVHWEMFKYLARRHQIAEIDLEGVNSPQRGWFKLGFGGDLRPYYQVGRAAPEGAA